MEYFLECRYDARQSFYKKAYVREEENESVIHKELVSYSTMVANYVYYKKTKKEVFEYFGNFSQTTTRHQKEFFRQNGLNDKEIKKLFNEGKLIKIEGEN